MKSRLRLTLLVTLLLFTLKDGWPDRSRAGLIKAQVDGYEFNYIAWEIEALWQKAQQTLFGFQPYYSEAESKALTIEYLRLVGQILTLEAQIEALYADTTLADRESALRELRQQQAELEAQRRELQSIVEPIIERQVAAVLRDEGFGILGQVLPPVSFRFVETPDVLIVSPRDTIRQDFAISLKPLSTQERQMIEARVEAVAPHDAAYITGTGGVGIWPAMVVETRFAAIAFEVVAHEWSHHYLFLFPSGMEYLVRPETRIINETTATVFGNAIALKILARFYRDEVAQGLIWIPDYPTLANFQGTPVETEPIVDEDALTVSDTIRARLTADYLLQMGRASGAQWTLDTAQRSTPIQDPDLLTPRTQPLEINRTRITTDYLLGLGRVEAAEAFMESQRQLLGMRVLNQAWFAFNGGYQSDPGQGGGISLIPVVDVTDPNFLGDPIGPAIHEIAALAPTLEEFLVILRGVTTRQELIEALVKARTRWG